MNRRVADVRVNRHEYRPGVFDFLPRLPLLRRHLGVVIVGPHQLFVGIDHADEDAIILGKRWRVRRHLESIGDVDRAAERHPIVAQRHAWRGHGGVGASLRRQPAADIAATATNITTLLMFITRAKGPSCPFLKPQCNHMPEINWLEQEPTDPKARAFSVVPSSDPIWKLPCACHDDITNNTKIQRHERIKRVHYTVTQSERRHFINTSCRRGSVAAAHFAGTHPSPARAVRRNQSRCCPVAASRLTWKRRSNHACKPQSSFDCGQRPTVRSRGTTDAIASRSASRSRSRPSAGVKDAPNVPRTMRALTILVTLRFRAPPKRCHCLPDGRTDNQRDGECKQRHGWHEVVSGLLGTCQDGQRPRQTH